MNENGQQIADTSPRSFPVIKQVQPSAILDWLHAGVEDTRRGGLSSLFYGVFFAAAGWLMHAVFAEAYGLFAGLTTGFCSSAHF